VSSDLLWQLQRGSRSLIQNLESVSGNMQLPLGDTLPRTEAASISEDLPAEKLWSIGSARVGIETQDEDVEVPDVMEEVIEQLLSGLRDKVQNHFAGSLTAYPCSGCCRICVECNFDPLFSPIW
jgi:hypothetical protein